MNGRKEEPLSVTQELQNKVDRLKLLNLTSNIHNLTPPIKQEDDLTRDIALVRALSVAPRIADLFMEIRGLEYDQSSRQFIQVTRPIMNILGAYRFCKLLKRLAEEIEWATYSEDELPQRIIHYFEENIPYFLFYGQVEAFKISKEYVAEELILNDDGIIIHRSSLKLDENELMNLYESYDLHPSDFNYIISVLQNFVDTAFHKSKQGKYINTLGRTYGEDILKKALEMLMIWKL
jgi:hypothetical protein